VEVKQIFLPQLREASSVVRTTWDCLEELAESLKEVGVLEPLIVRQVGSNYEIITGSRRFRAAKLAGLAAVPCVVKPHTELEAICVQLISNVQKQELNDLDIARAIQSLMRIGNLKVEQVALRIGKSAQYCWEKLKLLNLAPELQAAFDEGELPKGKASALARMDVGDQRAIVPMLAQMHRSEVIAHSREVRTARGNPRTGFRETTVAPEVNQLKYILSYPLPPQGLEVVRTCIRQLEALRRASIPTAVTVLKVPALAEVERYFRFLGKTSEDATDFYDYYQSNGWKVGANPMADWQASARRWGAKSFSTGKQTSVRSISDKALQEAGLA
jgi:ParB/RepB/Spo0J family partition protein